MGRIIIEIPQDVNLKYRIVSEDSAQKFLSNLERLLPQEKREEDEDILGLWTEPQKANKKTAS